MIEAYDNTLGYRIAFAITFFSVRGICDWLRHPENPARAKEYLFLVVSMIVAVLYGIIHDHITATISPEYFLGAKGLAADPRPFRLAVTSLAIKATYGPGVLAGAFLLIANNPSPKKPRLSYSHLLCLCVYPVAMAALGATAGGLWLAGSGRETWLVDIAQIHAPTDRVVHFLVVWGVHAGSYAGATLGTVLAIVVVHRRRQGLAAVERN